MTAADMDGLARWAYGQGVNPIDYAEGQAEAVITAHLQVMAGRLDDPASFPGYSQDLSMTALARRVVGTLMEAGWTAPDLGSAGNDPLPPAPHDPEGSAP